MLWDEPESNQIPKPCRDCKHAQLLLTTYFCSKQNTTKLAEESCWQWTDTLVDNDDVPLSWNEII